LRFGRSFGSASGSATGTQGSGSWKTMSPLEDIVAAAELDGMCDL